VSYFGKITQNVVTSAGNSSTTNLAVGNSYTFTGTVASTLNVAGIQVMLNCDQNATVQIQQSTTLAGPNWDLVDTFHFIPGLPFGVTVQAIGAAFRVVVTTVCLTTTYFRLSSILCPVVEAVPRSLDNDGRLTVSTRSAFDNYGFELEYTPGGELRAVEPFRLVGAAFDLNGNAGAVDPNFYTSNITNNGTVTQSNGQVVLDTAVTSANGAARLYTQRRARFVPGTTNQYRGYLVMSTVPITNFAARWGVVYGSSMPTITDGAWFQMSGTTFSVVTKRGNAADAVVTSFNGKLGASYVPVLTSLHRFEIYYGDGFVWFSIDGELLHKVTFAGSAFSTANLYAYTDVVNSGSLQTSNTMTVSDLSVNRLGAAHTGGHYGVVTTANTYNFKYGSGLLHGVVLGNGNAGTLITIYDDTTGTANVMSVLAAATGGGSFTNPEFVQFGASGIAFNNGLKVVSTGTWNATVIYE